MRLPYNFRHSPRMRTDSLCLSDADVNALVAYVRSLKKRTQILSACFSSAAAVMPAGREEVKVAVATALWAVWLMWKAMLAEPATGRWLEIANA